MLAFLAFLYVTAALLQIGGLLLAYRQLKRDASEESDKVDAIRQLMHEQESARESAEEEYNRTKSDGAPLWYFSQERGALDDQQDKELAELGYHRVTFDEAGLMFNHMWAAITQHAVDGYLRKGAMVLVGTALGAVASVWSLYV